jgi:putative ABC transport system permease protein
MDSLVHDLRATLRSLRRSPTFTAAVVVTLALGIGANTAIFSVVNGVILRPLPYRAPDRLVMIWEENKSMDFGISLIPTSPGNFTDYRSDTSVFADAGAFRYRSSTVGSDGDAEQLWGGELTPSMFTTLDVRPFVGRVFTPQEEEPGHSGVVLVSYDLWQRRFGGTTDIVGKSVDVDGDRRTIIGVMPEWFRFPLPSMYPILTKVKPEFWIPHVIAPAHARRDGRYLGVIARLRDGVTLPQARAAVAETSKRMAQVYPANNIGWTSTVVSLPSQIAAPVRPALATLAAAVALVLLIACANVANLQLARATRRQREVTVRAALGAGRRRIITQALTESVVLAAMGGALGLIVVVWGTDALRGMLPAGFPRAADVGVDTRVLAFALFASVMTGLVFGIVPAIRASRVDLARALNDGGRRTSSDRRSRRARSGLVVGQVALAIVLLVAAGLLTRSVARLMGVNPGFDPRGVLTASLRPPVRQYSDERARRQAYSALLERIARLPGVQSVSASSLVPFSEREDFYGVAIEGVPLPPGAQQPQARFYVVSPGYFETLRIPVLEGRSLTTADDETAPKVVVINRRFQQVHFPNGGALGGRVQSGSDEYRTVVGIVADVSYSGLDVTPKAELYVPYTQQDADNVALLIRTRADPLSLVAPLRASVREVANGTPLAEVATMNDLIDASVAQRRFTMALLVMFALLALVLASVGIYGVLSYAVAERSREIGIRRALGAQEGQVVRMVVGEGMRLTAVGLVSGIGAAFVASRAMRGLLYGIGTGDPATFAAVTALVAAVAFAASYLPARRAAHVDPTDALRAD